MHHDIRDAVLALTDEQEAQWREKHAPPESAVAPATEAEAKGPKFFPSHRKKKKKRERERKGPRTAHKR